MKNAVIIISEIMSLASWTTLLFEYAFENRDCRGEIIGILFATALFFTIVKKVAKKFWIVK